MNYVIENIPLWAVTIWDKKYNAVDRTWQPQTIKYNHLLSDELDSINVGAGNVRLLYTGKDVGFTTEELAGDNLCEGEVVSIPWGGTPSVKYYKGKFVTGDNRIATSNNPNELSNKFLYYYLRGHISEIASYYRGAGLKHPSMRDVLNMKISYPSLTDQNKICEQFDVIERIIEKRTEEIYLLDELIKARFVEMFGDTEQNSNEYIEMKLGDICDLQNGYAFKSGDYVDSSDVNNCRMSNIRPDGGFDADYSPKYLPNEFWDKYSAYRLYDGDVIIAMTDMASDPKILGVPTLVKTNGKKFLLNQRVGKLVFSENEQFNRVFLMRFLSQNYIRKNLAKKAGGSTQINIGKPAILEIRIVRPPIESQNQFAHFVQQVDKSKVEVQKALDEAQLLFDSLMQQYFG